MCCTEKKRKNHECQVCSGTTCVWVGTAMFGMHVCDMEGEKGLRWIRIIKAANDVSKARHLLVAMGPPSRHAPSTSSGFPPILCNLTAVIPIMPQLRTLYPCHYPQLLSVDQGDTAVPAQTPLLAQISGKPDIFSHSIYSTKSENHLKESNGNISHSFWLDYIQEAVSEVHTSIDWMAFCYDVQKANICYGGEGNKINVDSGQLTGSKQRLLITW